MSPESRIDTLNKLGFDLIFTDPVEARFLFNTAVESAKLVNYPKGQALALKNKAISYDIQGNSNQAIAYYQESLVILETLRDTLGISRIKNNLGIAYKNLEDLETARKFYQESIFLKKLLGDRKGVAYGMNNIGELFQREKSYKEALEYFSKANSILDSLGDNHGRSITLSNMAVSYLETGDYQTAITFLHRSMELDLVLEDQYSLSYSYILLAKAYLNTGQPSAGLRAIENAEKISSDMGALKVYYDSQVLKAQLLRRVNRVDLLPDLYEEILMLNDSLARMNLTEETAKMKAIYESREKELEIEDLRKESDLNHNLIEAQKRLFTISMWAVSLLVVLLVIVFVLYRKGQIAKKEAQHANQAKSQFLAQMSHEIRTPLNAVIGYTDQLFETNLDDTQRKHMAIVNQSALGLLGLINGILDLSKLEAGKLELVIEHTDLIELCNHVVQMTNYKAGRKNLNLKLTGVADEYRYVQADDTRLRQVLVNLLANAVKFTKEGEIELSVEAKGKPENGKVTYKFAVRDTGIGIKPENLHKIFHAFSQEDSSTTRKYGGTGLGLSISNILLELMGSSLSVESTPGKGSTFSFEVVFPISDEQKREDPQAKTGSEITKKVVSTSDKLKVLIAEDNATNMVLVKLMLKKALPHAKMLEARNGLEAVQLFAEERPGIILMDVQMPEMDGYSASREIRKLETKGRTPIIAITAGSMSADKEKCYEAGMDDFISKPIVNDALAVTLEKWVGEWS